MRNLFILFLLFTGLSSFLILWDTSPEIFLVPITQDKTLPEADSYMNNSETVRFAVTGDREYSLTAAKSLFYKERGFWQVDRPHLIAYDTENGNQPWELKAENGEVLNHGDVIRLLNNVTGWQYTGIDEKRELLTSAIDFYPEQQLVKTDQSLTIKTPEGVTTATGMTANFSTGVFTLLSNVKGVYRAP